MRNWTEFQLQAETKLKTYWYMAMMWVYHTYTIHHESRVEYKMHLFYMQYITQHVSQWKSAYKTYHDSHIKLYGQKYSKQRFKISLIILPEVSATQMSIGLLSHNTNICVKETTGIILPSKYDSFPSLLMSGSSSSWTGDLICCCFAFLICEVFLFVLLFSFPK